jgi:hypothetical protein
MDISEIRGAVSGAEAFLTVAAGARDDDAPAPLEPEAGTIDVDRANFLVFFIGFAKASSTSDDLLRPDFAFGKLIFSGAVFFFAATLARFPAALPLASTFLFFEASTLASVPYAILATSNTRFKRPLLGSSLTQALCLTRP